MSEPIRIDVDCGDYPAPDSIVITDAVAAQIVARAGAMERLAALAESVERLASDHGRHCDWHMQREPAMQPYQPPAQQPAQPVALGSWSRDMCPTCRQHRSVMGMPCNDSFHISEPTTAADGGAGDGAVEAMEYVYANNPGLTVRHGMRAILAAIRANPALYVPEIAELKARLAEAERQLENMTICNNQHAANCTDLAKRLEAVTRGRDDAQLEVNADLRARLASEEKMCADALEQHEITEGYITEIAEAFDPEWEWSNLRTESGLVTLVREHMHAHAVLKADRDRLKDELREAHRDQEAVWNYLKPNESNDMPWCDEIIVAIDNRVLAAEAKSEAHIAALRAELARVGTRPADAELIQMLKHDRDDLARQLEESEKVRCVLAGNVERLQGTGANLAAANEALANRDDQLEAVEAALKRAGRSHRERGITGETMGGAIASITDERDDLAKRLEAVTRGRDDALSGETKALADLAAERSLTIYLRRDLDIALEQRDASRDRNAEMVALLNRARCNIPEYRNAELLAEIKAVLAKNVEA